MTQEKAAELHIELKRISTRLANIAEMLLEKTEIQRQSEAQFMEEFAKATVTFTDEEPPFEADPVKKSRIKIVTRMKSSGKFPGQYFSAMLAGTGGTPISVLGFGEYAQFQPGDIVETDLEEKTASNGSTYFYLKNAAVIQQHA